MKIASFALSDVGRVRRENQDSSGHFPDCNLFVVADGMGGHQGGKQASEMAVATIAERLATHVARGQAFHRVNPSLDLSPEAMAAAEPLLAVAVGLAMPGGRE